MRDRGPHGILLIDKPDGTTSAGVVRQIKRRLGGVKVGHLGTLDPFATGLLPVCVGEGSKVVPFLNQEEKAYEAILRLGIATDTLDATGREVETKPVRKLAPQDLEAVAASFTGRISQIPPMYSAVKQAGIPLYRRARHGEVVDRNPRDVEIRSLDLQSRRDGDLDLRVRCSKGTYVRVLGADIAAALGTVGHLRRLRRTAFGPFTVDDAVSPDHVDRENLPGMLTPREALTGRREIAVDAAGASALRKGQQTPLRRLSPPNDASEVAKVIAPDGDLVAIVGGDGGLWRLLRVLHEH